MCGLCIAMAVVMEVFKVPISLLGIYDLKLTFTPVALIFISVTSGPMYGRAASMGCHGR
jgi:hypothetical protein